jgi:hypothetical protein
MIFQNLNRVQNYSNFGSHFVHAQRKLQLFLIIQPVLESAIILKIGRAFLRTEYIKIQEPPVWQKQVTLIDNRHAWEV